MKRISFDGKLNYLIDNIGFVNVLRNSNHIVPYKGGKSRYTIVLVVDGKMNYYFTETKLLFTLSAGDALFIPKNYPYVATYVEDNTIAKVLTFDIYSENLPSFFSSPIHKNSAPIVEIGKAISGEPAYSTVFLASSIYGLLYEIEKTNETLPDKYKKIIPALKQIHQNYFENRKIAYYAELCYMSESNFRKLFKEYTGKTLIEYRNLIRISKAKEMIESGEFKVTEAAYLTGFNNMSFFYEVLNKHAKMQKESSFL